MSYCPAWTGQIRDEEEDRTIANGAAYKARRWLCVLLCLKTIIDNKHVRLGVRLGDDIRPLEVLRRNT